MQLLTKEIEKRFATIGRQDSNDPVVVAKFFNPTGAGYWFATEYDPAEKMFFGYVSIFNDHNNEFGTFSLAELESVRGAMGLGIERDRFFTEKLLSQAKKTNGIV